MRTPPSCTKQSGEWEYEHPGVNTVDSYEMLSGDFNGVGRFCGIVDRADVFLSSGYPLQYQGTEGWYGHTPYPGAVRNMKQLKQSGAGDYDNDDQNDAVLVELYCYYDSAPPPKVVCHPLYLIGNSFQTYHLIFCVNGLSLLNRSSATENSFAAGVSSTNATFEVNEGEAVSIPQFNFRVEAEKLALSNYAIEKKSDASSGELVQVATGTGTATSVFDKEEGSYNISIGYIDKDDGAATFELYIAGSMIDSWTANQTTSGWMSRTQTVENVTLLPGKNPEIL